MSDSFRAAMATLDRSGDQPPVVCDLFISTFAVSGAAVSTVGNVLGSETLGASDEKAARLDELQFDLGEGPCWDAIGSGDAVLEPRVRQGGRQRWPAFSASVEAEEVSSVFAFPLSVGPLRFGAVDLYSVRPMSLDPAQTEQALAMAGVVGRHVLRSALSKIGADGEEEGNAYSRRLVHQATGMVLAQIDVPPDDARLVIQGHAFAADRSMMEIAQDIIDGKLRFTRVGMRIEAES